MRKNNFLPIVAVALLTLTGCRKIWDYFVEHPDDPARNCRIEKVTFDTQIRIGEDQYAPFAGVTTFSYNSYGNPISILSNIPNKEDDPYFEGNIFTYDSANRLRVYLDDLFVPRTHWHVYSYVSPKEIIDSVFNYAFGDHTRSDHPTRYADITVNRLNLDSYGRVIVETSSFRGVVTTKRYSYDFSGNLERSGVTYTSRPNIRVTNKVWQLIDRDYSVNQPRGEVSEVNAHGLPKVFSSQMDNTEVFFRFANPGKVISYSCE